MECHNCHKEWEIKEKEYYDVYTRGDHKFIHEKCPMCGHINEVELIEIDDPDMIQAIVESVHATFH